MRDSFVPSKRGCSSSYVCVLLHAAINQAPKSYLNSGAISYHSTYELDILRKVVFCCRITQITQHAYDCVTPHAATYVHWFQRLQTQRIGLLCSASPAKRLQQPNTHILCVHSVIVNHISQNAWVFWDLKGKLLEFIRVCLAARRYQSGTQKLHEFWCNFLSQHLLARYLEKSGLLLQDCSDITACVRLCDAAGRNLRALISGLQGLQT